MDLKNYRTKGDFSTDTKTILGWEFIKEKKKVRKQENTHSFKKKKLIQEKTIIVKKIMLSTKRPTQIWSRKKCSFFFSWSFLGRERVFLSKFFFLDDCVFSWRSACFLVFLLFFFYKFPAPGLNSFFERHTCKSNSEINIQDQYFRPNEKKSFIKNPVWKKICPILELPYVWLNC